MSNYFDTEMRLLQEEAQEFARAFPEKARHLNLQDVKDRDPYVERLLEGMAFLTGEVKRRIDDDIPEFSEALLNHIRPYFLRPFPSCTIMQFNPRPGQMKETTCIPKGTLTFSDGINLPKSKLIPFSEWVSCRFRTTGDTILQPLSLAGVELDNSMLKGQLLKLRFQFDHDINAQQLDLKNLKIYLHGDTMTTLELYRALTAQVSQVQIAFPALAVRPQRLGRQNSLLPCHLTGNDLLLPTDGRGFVGFHLLHDYFCFREKYQFVSIEQLDCVNWPERCSEFEIRIELKEPLDADLRLTTENFKLHCVPAINLYEKTGEPIRVDKRRSEYHVVADNNLPRAIQVYSVDEVCGAKRDDGMLPVYNPLHRYNYQDKKQRYYQVSHRLREELGPMTYLRIGGALSDQDDIISCAITAYNGDIPRNHLKVDSIKSPASGFPSHITATNITRPSKMHLPPQRSDYRLALIAHLSVSHNSIASVEQLQQLLSLYDWSDQLQSEKRIQSLKAVTMQPLSKIHRGAMLKGVDIGLTLDEKMFLSEADSYLFGTVLHHFFSMYVAINTFVQSRIQFLTSRTSYQWDPLLGENFLI